MTFWEIPRACSELARSGFLSKGCSSHKREFFLWKAVEKVRGNVQFPAQSGARAWLNGRISIGRKKRRSGVAGFVVELGVQTPAGVNVEERPFEGRVVRRMRWPSGPVYRTGIVRPLSQGLKPFAGGPPYRGPEGPLFHGILPRDSSTGLSEGGFSLGESPQWLKPN